MSDYKKAMEIDAQESTKYFNSSLSKKTEQQKTLEKILIERRLVPETIADIACGGGKYVKSSQVINPNGVFFIPALSHDELDVFGVGPAIVSKFRQTFSTTQDRKPALYKSIL